MTTTPSPFSQIRSIDNNKRTLPFATIILIILLFLIFIWFIRGGSYQLYASLFFTLYHVTNQAWLSIILVSVIQNIFFLPFHVISHRLDPELKDFEIELEKTHEEKQYFVFSNKIREGNLPIVFYTFKFVILAIAFISAGRVFLLDFYNEKISPHYLYDLVPYPEYPLQGTIFNFPFFKITQIMSLDWTTIFKIWGIILLFLIITRVIWLLLRFFLSKNAKILRFRIGYNRLRLLIGGFIGTLFIVSLIVLRNIPLSLESITLSANLALQNTSFNIITAVATFFATIKMGYDHNQEGVNQAKKANIPPDIISRVFRQNMKETLRNAILLSVFAYYITRLLPCSHDLSVLAFEALYVISPLTFDKLVSSTASSKPAPPPSTS